MNDEVLKRIDALAAKLNTTGEHLWNVLLAQVRVEIIERSLILFALACALAAAYKYLRWQGEEDDGYNHPGVVIAILACSVIVCAFVGVLSGIPTLLMNPEYWALKQILEAHK